MKKIYQSPKALIVEIQINKGLLLSTSETIVGSSYGGWVKEENTYNTNNSSVSDVNVWDNEW